MQATITYLLSEQAQRAQMAATGQPVTRTQTVVEDLPADLISHPLVSIDAAGNATIDLTKASGYWEDGSINWIGSGYGAVYPHLDSLPASGIQAVRDRIAAVEDKVMAMKTKNEQHRAEVLTKEERAIDAFFADPSLRGGVIVPDGLPHLPAAIVPDGLPHLPAAIIHYSPRLAQVREEIERRNRADREAKAANEQAKEQAKCDFIDAWFGDPSSPVDEETRQQFRDGLLARNEALALIADAAFSQYEIEEYSPGICPRRDCSCGRNKIDALPRSAYPAFRALKSRLPEGVALEIEEVRECLRDEDGYAEDGEDSSDPVYAVNVKLPVGPFTFERLVRL